jgi:hypothetical protein
MAAVLEVARDGGRDGRTVETVGAGSFAEGAAQLKRGIELKARGAI